MKKRSVFLAILIFIFLTMPVMVQASPSPWSTFGKNQQRIREAIAQHTQPPLYLKWQVPHIGWSISQPIIADGFIFHQAGGYLYKIPLNLGFLGGVSVHQLLNDGARRVKISNKYHAASHPVYDEKQNVLYVGTADNRIREIDPQSLRIERTYVAGGRLVNAPSILGDELIAFGQGDAVLYLYKGGKRRFIRFAPPSTLMEITGTFAVKKTTNPIIFVPVNYRWTNRPGFVDAYQIIDRGFGKAPSFRFVWRHPFTTDNGVSASVVYDKHTDRIYFADKSGAVYAVDAATGKQVWKNTSFRSASSGVTLVNNSPALGENTLVIPFRYQGGRGRGLVVAFNKNTGAVQWARTSAGKRKSSGDYDGEIASAPVINQDGSGHAMVLIGTTRGDLRAFRLKSGKPTFITIKNGQKQKVLHAISGGESSIYQGQGLATEITVADGHIIFGANSSAYPNAHGTNGILYAYSTPWAYPKGTQDLSGRIGVPKKVRQGLPLRVFETPTNIGKANVDKPFTTKLYVNGVLIDKRKLTDLKVGQERGTWVTAPSVFATNQLGRFQVKLVVDAGNHIKEAVEQNNVITKSYQVVPAPPTKCPNGGKWNGHVCIRKWTEHHVYHHRTKSVLIR